jgi:hypothetical protein
MCNAHKMFETFRRDVFKKTEQFSISALSTEHVTEIIGQLLLTTVHRKYNWNPRVTFQIKIFWPL